MKLLKFGAPWCAACVAMEPLLEQLASEYPQFEFVPVDVEQQPAVAAQYRVRSLPTLVVVDDTGCVLGQHVGLASRAEIVKLLEGEKSKKEGGSRAS